MPDLNDLNKYLSKDELKDGDLLDFIDAGKFEKRDFSKAKDGSDIKTVFEITVKTEKGTEKIITLNKTSQTSLSAEWGTKTEAWVGKVAKVQIVKQLAFGKMMDVVVLFPTEEIPF